MTSNPYLKILCSIPAIIIIGYFIPFIGICLIMMRYFVKEQKQPYSTALNLIVIGGLILSPQIIAKGLKILKLKNVKIPYLEVVVSSDVYVKLLSYSKFLIITGIIFLIISLLLKKLSNKASSYLSSYMAAKIQSEAEMSQKNDLLIKLKQEKAKITDVIYCPHCGADNILTDKVGKCKYCRRSLKNQDDNKNIIDV